jgi:hypothetical protein
MEHHRVVKADVGTEFEYVFRKDLPTEIHTVKPACKHSGQNSGRWFCITHKKGFENQLQKDSHIHTGKHALAWFCFECNEYQQP